MLENIYYVCHSILLNGADDMFCPVFMLLCNFIEQIKKRCCLYQFCNLSNLHDARHIIGTI